MRLLVKQLRQRGVALWVPRAAATALLLIVAPALLVTPALLGEEPIRVEEPSPRTVLAPTTIRVADEEATERARQQAIDGVQDVRVTDPDTRARVVRRVADVFDAARELRQPVEPAPVDLPDEELFDEDGEPVELPEPPPPTPPEPEEQEDALARQFAFIDDDLATALVDLPDRLLDRLEQETTEVVRQLARQELGAEELDRRVSRELEVELGVRNLPGDTGSTVLDPLVRAVMLPTVRIDSEETDRLRTEAASEVAEVTRTFPAGTPVVEVGTPVDGLQFDALVQLGVEGAEIGDAVLRATLMMLLVSAATGLYLRFVAHRLWTVGRKLVVLATLTVLYSGLVAGTAIVADQFGTIAWFALPVATLPLLATLLLGSAVGAAFVVPAALLPLAVDPSMATVAAYAAVVALLAVPLVARIESRSALRIATSRAAAAAAVVAGVAALVSPGLVPTASAAAGLGGGALTILLVNGLLPFLESAFRLPTVTALLDLADRNHPLLRELEDKALGSYNHSITVATLVERACREIGANALLGSVAALYHDIGKVRQPLFFVENQQGIANPHDELEPQVSALVIQNHVVDGVELAVEHRLPPEVVACIGSHHGTMLVKFFYTKAVDAADDPDQVDEATFRYKGSKPRSKEAAIVMLADSCEAVTRSMAMSKGTLPPEDIEATVKQLFAERVDDGQLEEAELTFAELRTVERSLITALGGIYHPRIAYPKAKRRAADDDTDPRP